MDERVKAKMVAVLELPVDADDLDILEAVILLKKNKPYTHTINNGLGPLIAEGVRGLSNL